MCRGLKYLLVFQSEIVQERAGAQTTSHQGKALGPSCYYFSHLYEQEEHQMHSFAKTDVSSSQVVEMEVEGVIRNKKRK